MFWSRFVGLRVEYWFVGNGQLSKVFLYQAIHTGTMEMVHCLSKYYRNTQWVCSMPTKNNQNSVTCIPSKVWVPRTAQHTHNHQAPQYLLRCQIPSQPVQGTANYFRSKAEDNRREGMADCIGKSEFGERRGIALEDAMI